MATYYITNHGNDNNDGLSLKTSWRTLSRAEKVLSSSHTYYIDGLFYDLDKISYIYYRIFKGLNNAKINGKNQYRGSRLNSYFKNFEIYNFSCLFDYNPSTFKNCYFHDIKIFSRNLNTGYSSIVYCVFNNVNHINLGGIIRNNTNNTFHNCKNIYIHINNTTYNYGNIKQNIIFSNSSIRITNKTDLQYCLFINCSFWFSGGGLGTDETEYTYPSGTSGDEKLQNLRERMANVYGEYFVDFYSDYLIGCVYYTGSYEDIFIDADNDDFHLVPGCIAEHLNRDGNYIGAKSTSTLINLNQFTLTNVGTNGEILNDNIDSNIISNIIDLGTVKKILSFKNISKLFIENGTQLNLDNTLGTNINASENVLTNQTKYMVFNNNIFTNEPYMSAHEPYTTFIANEQQPIIDENGTSGNGLGFITYENGIVKEVLYDNNNTLEKFKLKCSKTNSLLTDAVELIMYVNGTPKVNIDRYGNPIIGNADINFNDDESVYLYTRYIQYNIDIKSNNIPSL